MVFIYTKELCAFLPHLDSPRHRTHQPHPSVEEDSRAVCIPSESNAGSKSLPGGFLDGCPQKQRSAGEHRHMDMLNNCLFLKKGHCLRQT